MSVPSTVAASDIGGTGPRSFARRDRLVAIEAEVSARWTAAHEGEANAPLPGAPRPAKFFATFPYPYMNGRLHLGHAFTVSKAEFAARFQRLQGKNVLFPFAFHCTGMPIQAAANRLRREYESGVPAAIDAKLAAGLDTVAPTAEVEEEVETAAVVDVPAPPTASAGTTPDATTTDASPEKALGKFVGKKTKAVAKGSGAAMSQYEILLRSGISSNDIKAFIDPTHWLRFFPPLGEQDLRSFGLLCDWRRSFITTDANPFYDSFIRWQFNTLKKRGKLGFGKRPTIFSPIDGQACADHDRASGEGVQPQEYTLVKMRVTQVPVSHPSATTALAPLAALISAGRSVYFVAATLRPETMYGQTNCFLLPEGEYGAFEVGSVTGSGDVFLCTERSARNMSYQGLSAAGRGNVAPVGVFRGEDLLGLPLSAPYAAYSTIYTLPLLTISMKKGTGVVTSVPSDAPDDWAALRDLREKPKLREKYNLTEEMVAPAVVEIIDIPGYGRTAALAVCDQLKIRSQNDAALLKQAKELVYATGFYQGTLLVGKYAGKKVCDAKPLVRADLMAEGLAVAYWEPENLVTSRSGDECVVAELDQWYLTYGEDEWRGAVEAWVKGPDFATFSGGTKAAFELTLSWLKEWACSRSFGLGTR